MFVSNHSYLHLFAFLTLCFAASGCDSSEPQEVTSSPQTAQFINPQTPAPTNDGNPFSRPYVDPETPPQSYNIEVYMVQRTENPYTYVSGSNTFDNSFQGYQYADRHDKALIWDSSTPSPYIKEAEIGYRIYVNGALAYSIQDGRFPNGDTFKVRTTEYREGYGVYLLSEECKKSYSDFSCLGGSGFFSWNYTDPLALNDIPLGSYKAVMTVYDSIGRQIAYEEDRVDVYPLCRGTHVQSTQFGAPRCDV